MLQTVNGFPSEIWPRWLSSIIGIEPHNVSMTTQRFWQGNSLISLLLLSDIHVDVEKGMATDSSQISNQVSFIIILSATKEEGDYLGSVRPLVLSFQEGEASNRYSLWKRSPMYLIKGDCLRALYTGIPQCCWFPWGCWHWAHLQQRLCFCALIALFSIMQVLLRNVITAGKHLFHNWGQGWEDMVRYAIGCWL